MAARHRHPIGGAPEFSLPVSRNPLAARIRKLEKRLSLLEAAILQQSGTKVEHAGEVQRETLDLVGDRGDDAVDASNPMHDRISEAKAAVGDIRFGDKDIGNPGPLYDALLSATKRKLEELRQKLETDVESTKDHLGGLFRQSERLNRELEDLRQGRKLEGAVVDLQHSNGVFTGNRTAASPLQHATDEPTKHRDRLTAEFASGRLAMDLAPDPDQLDGQEQSVMDTFMSGCKKCHSGRHQQRWLGLQA